MHASARPHDTLNRRRFLSISGQSLLAFSLSQLIPVNLLAEER
ncbi:MAG: transcriptional initiation protein Tat, partial [Gammaproteobacteria bacterium HGW-Gammaproteobacteria-6]